MKIITSSTGKNKLSIKKSEWIAIGKKAGWFKDAGTFATPEGLFETPYDDSDVPQKTKPASEAVMQSISQEPANEPAKDVAEETQVQEVKKPVKSWLDEPEKKEFKTPMEVLQDKVDEVLGMEIPLVLARGLELTDLGNKTFVLQFGKKRFKGKPADILRVLHQIKQEYSEPFETIGEE